MAHGTRIDAIYAHLAAGRVEQARAAALREAGAHPGDLAAVSAAAVAHARAGDMPRAEHFARRAASLSPHDAEVLHNLGKVLLDSGKVAEALPHLTAAIGLSPDLPPLHQSLAAAYIADEQPYAAANVLRQAVERWPTEAPLRAALAGQLHQLGQAEAALSLLEPVVRARPDDLAIADQLCVLLNYTPGIAAERIAAEHRRYGALLDAAIPPPARCPPGPARDGPLRVGLLSPDLREHAVMRFLRPIASHAAGNGLELLCYHVGTRVDDQSDWLRARSAIFRHEPRTPQPRLAEIIRRDRPDVLIDLAGHTRQNRLATMQRRPAPVQATYLGYPTTTGLGAIDARITDATIDPPGAEHLNSERLLRLDGCSHCFDPGEVLPEINARPAGAPLVFASVGTMLKHNEQTTDLWARALHAVPGSRLLIKNPGTREAALREAIVARFAAKGLDPARIDVRPPIDRPLEAYAEIDIVLDTFPYNGTTTTCEALWMGVPVVTLRGETHASRVGASLLTTAGLGEWIAGTPAAFVEIARSLATDRARLAALRSSLRERAQRSPLGDSAAFAAKFAGAMRTLATDRAG